MLSELQNSNKIVGLKQVVNSIGNGTAKKVFLAKDVSPDIYDHILNLCKVNEIPLSFADTRKQLGNACKIDVPAAVAVIID